MRKKFFTVGLFLIIIMLICAVLYLNGDYIVYILSYVFCFAFFLCYCAHSDYPIKDKIVQTVIYALILAIQILFAVFVLRLSGDEELCRLLGVAFLFTPFLVKQLFFSWIK